MKIYNDKLEAMPELAATTALRAFWQGPQPRAWLNSAERVHLPVARSPKAMMLLNGVGPMISISNDTAVAKMSKHKKLNTDMLANIDEIIASGEWYQGTRAGAVDVFAEFGDNVWKIVLSKSAEGFLYVRTIFATSSKKRRGRKISD